MPLDFRQSRMQPISPLARNGLSQHCILATNIRFWLNKLYFRMILKDRRAEVASRVKTRHPVWLLMSIQWAFFAVCLSLSLSSYCSLSIDLRRSTRNKKKKKWDVNSRSILTNARLLGKRTIERHIERSRQKKITLTLPWETSDYYLFKWHLSISSVFLFFSSAFFSRSSESSQWYWTSTIETTSEWASRAEWSMSVEETLLEPK